MADGYQLLLSGDHEKLLNCHRDEDSVRIALRKSLYVDTLNATLKTRMAERETKIEFCESVLETGSLVSAQFSDFDDCVETLAVIANTLTALGSTDLYYDGADISWLRYHSGLEKFQMYAPPDGAFSVYSQGSAGSEDTYYDLCAEHAENGRWVLSEDKETKEYRITNEPGFLKCGSDSPKVVTFYNIVCRLYMQNSSFRSYWTELEPLLFADTGAHVDFPDAYASALNIQTYDPDNQESEPIFILGEYCCRSS